MIPCRAARAAQLVKLAVFPAWLHASPYSGGKEQIIKVKSYAMNLLPTLQPIAHQAGNKHKVLQVRHAGSLSPLQQCSRVMSRSQHCSGIMEVVCSENQEISIT